MKKLLLKKDNHKKASLSGVFFDEKLNDFYEYLLVNSSRIVVVVSKVLSIAAGKVIRLPESKRTNRKLREAGLEVIEVPFKEMIKSAGSFRCCTMPIDHEK